MILHTEAYDPDDSSDAPRSSSQYISGKDVRIIGAVLLVLALILFPIYQYYKRRALEYRTKNNMLAIYKAIQQYAGENDDRFPPTYVTAEGSDAPYLEDGKPYVWANLPTIDGGLNPRVSFRCPAADQKEVTLTQGDRSAELTYGMYQALSGLAANEVENQSGTVLLAETSNYGSMGSYNPVPFTDSEGNPMVNDGFLVSFEDSNLEYTGKARKVTRLAYRDTANGDFGLPGNEGAAKPGRHEGGIHFLFADGHIEKLPSQVALIRWMKRGAMEENDTPWAVPTRSLMRPQDFR